MPLVTVGTAWGAPIKSIPLSTRVKTGSGSFQPLSGSRYSEVKARPQMGTASLYEGWREPTVFRGYACKIIPADGDFHYYGRNSANTAIEHTGKHYPHTSQVLFAGTEGTARYPINNGSDNQARVECLANLDKAKLQLGVTLAEMNTTMLMLARSLTDLRKYMTLAYNFLSRNVYRRHHIQRVLRLLGTRSGRREARRYMSAEAANRWLEYQYGWKPLLADIYGLASLLDEQAKAKHTITGRAYVSSGVNPTVPFTAPVAGEIFTNPIVTAGAFCRMDWKVENAVARQLNRLGLSNIFEIGWELIPFSFVLDWVAPIGDYLGALAGGWGLTYVGGSITRFSTADISVTWSQYRFERGTRISYTVKSVAWFRYPVSDTNGRLYVKNPLTSVSRAVTALALLTQMRSKKG